MTKSLDSKIKSYVNNLPYWAQYICTELLSGKTISDELIDTSFDYLLEELALKEQTEKSELNRSETTGKTTDYNAKTRLQSLAKVKGVNALSKNQTIEFSPNLTILYGANSAGKSGYIRLLKKALYSKDKSEILGDINNPGISDKINAKFKFSTLQNPLIYPDDKEEKEFEQISVLDGLVCQKHLCDRNDFSFRPAGLALFSEFNTVLEKVNNKLSAFIRSKSHYNPFAEDGIFSGDSEIKKILSELTHKSNLDELKKNHLPFTEEDVKSKVAAEKKCDDYKIAIFQKDKTKKELRGIKSQIETKQKKLNDLNNHFKQEQLDQIASSISDCITKQEIAKNEGIDKFKTKKIEAVGSSEWKAFILSAKKFAEKQKADDKEYPEEGDFCIFCQQPIQDDETIKLINSYWDYIKSLVEKEAKEATEKVQKYKNQYESLDFNLFPETDTLTVWLKDNYPKHLEEIKNSIVNQNDLANLIANSLEKLSENANTKSLLDYSFFDKFVKKIDEQIKSLENTEQTRILSELERRKIYFRHKEKLQQRINEIEKLHQNMIAVNKADTFNKRHWKSNSTNTEKQLSNEFFNKDYINAFNEECEKLDGNFGIDIDARSSDARSNRQLFLKGNAPSVILSEGEQKVIALADFIAENEVSEINTGMVFDDPVTSLDEERKCHIAERLVAIAEYKQVVVFTHDLVFVSSLVNASESKKIELRCHWVEKNDNSIGIIWLDNSPSFEKKYKKSGIAQDFYQNAKKAPPEKREILVKSGFAALRSSYEAFVIFDLLSGVVQRFNDRVSVDSLTGVHVDQHIVSEILDAFGLACRYMEGHSHSDKYSAKKPTPDALNEEIERFNSLKKKIKKYKKSVEVAP